MSHNSESPVPKNQKLCKGVLLDMDGLMLDTERMETALYVQLSREMGWPTGEDFLKTTIGIAEADSEAVYKARFGPDYPYREIWRRVIAAFADKAGRGGIPHRPGLLTLLDRLAYLRIPAAVATSSIRKYALAKLEMAGISARFAVLACGDEVKRGKPSPDVFLLAARRLGFEPADCIGFEDSPAGLCALTAAGIRSVFVKDLAEPPPQVLASVWRQCADLEEAAGLFGPEPS
jgi:HAD superfamily hydrolase (TIGR01509 family)